MDPLFQWAWEESLMMCLPEPQDWRRYFTLVTIQPYPKPYNPISTSSTNEQKKIRSTYPSPLVPNPTPSPTPNPTANTTNPTTNPQNHLALIPITLLPPSLPAPSTGLW